MTTWITRLDPEVPAGAVRVAVKDAIDVRGLPTTNGSRAGDPSTPAAEDAECVARVRAAGGVVVGKTNLHELCFGTTGVNPVFGTPVNPRAPGLVPGGSSSGSATAVASGEADLAIGTDTGGSVRIPAACCGVVGLKTTHGRIPLSGVRPLAPSFDTVGAIGPDVSSVFAGMRMLDPTFATAGVVRPAGLVARLRLPAGAGIDPRFEAAVDDAVTASGLASVDVEEPGWVAACDALVVLLMREAWQSLGHLLAGGLVGDPVAARLAASAAVTDDHVSRAGARRQQWRRRLEELLAIAPVLALPTLVGEPDPVDAAEPRVPNLLCAPANLAGAPAISIPLRGPVGCALQLVAAPGADELLCATAAVFEAAVTPGAG